MKIEIFRTDVNDVYRADELIQLLRIHLPDCQINFDLEDCDKILRIKGEFEQEKISQVLKTAGQYCELID